MPQYPAEIKLADLDGENGFKIGGPSGRAVAGAGDVNGDGFADVIVAAPYAFDHGVAYVMFGKAGGFDAVVSPADLDGTNGFALHGAASGDRFGQSAQSAGDVNGDGYDDVIIGAIGADPHTSYSGTTYVVFGSAGGFAPSLNVSDLDGTNGFALDGAFNFGLSGYSSSSAGDVNGDGIDDIIVGANLEQDNHRGSAYVIFGKTSGWDERLQLSSLNGSNGFRILGDDYNDRLGVSVASAGDVNGDGVADLIVGADDDSDPAQGGKAYIIFGTTAGFAPSVNVAGLDGTNGFRLKGAHDSDFTGNRVASAGDVNGDGYADVIVGAWRADPGGVDYAGTSYVVFGKAGGFEASIDLAGLDGNDGFALNGIDDHDFSGFWVDSAGDVNGDGFDDVIVGAVRADSSTRAIGESYVVFGKEGAFDAKIALSSLNGDNGFQITGEDFDYGESGSCVDSAGDINGDGFDDLIIGAPGASSSYVVFGAMPGEAVTRNGTAIDNTIHGGNFNDTLNGLGGDDTLIGHGGNDTLMGGGGNDSLDGGNGNDVLSGSSARDILKGGSGLDRIVGGGNGDVIDGGSAADTFVYGSASDSTGVNFDKLKDVDFSGDRFDLVTAVTGIDASVESGMLRRAQFDSDLAAAADGAHLGANHAVLFTPDAGKLAGKTFLIVDLNGIAGYQAGEDLVMNLMAPKHADALDISDFI